MHITVEREQSETEQIVAKSKAERSKTSQEKRLIVVQALWNMSEKKLVIKNNENTISHIQGLDTQRIFI